jgi:ADP-ribosyl-[dinitrogen reductase] hydrolase
VALHALHDAATARGIAAEQSRTTHGVPQAVEACALFVDLLRGAIQMSKFDFLKADTAAGEGLVAGCLPS